LIEKQVGAIINVFPATQCLCRNVQLNFSVEKTCTQRRYFTMLIETEKDG